MRVLIIRPPWLAFVAAFTLGVIGAAAVLIIPAAIGRPDSPLPPMIWNKRDNLRVVRPTWAEASAWPNTFQPIPIGGELFTWANDLRPAATQQSSKSRR